MTLRWLHPEFLPLALLLAIPILIHLFARARPPILPFSSIEFIRRVVKFTQRIRRPHDRWLLLLRALLMAALVGLFLGPLWFSRAPKSGPGISRSVVLLVDASASMSYVEGAQSRFAAACAEASRVLSDLSANDRANLVWMRATPVAVFAEPGVNHEFLIGALRRAKASREASNPEAALRLAVEMLDQVEGHREICLISDFQQSAWQDIQMNIPSSIEVVSLPVGHDPGDNQALSDIRVQPAEPLLGEDITLLCEVHNYSAKARQSQVFLEIGEIHEKQDIALQPWGAATASFQLKLDQPGPHIVAIRLNEDRFPADNSGFTLVNVRKHLRIGLLNKEPTAAASWTRALQAMGWFELQPLDEAQWNGLANMDALMLAGWDGTNALPVQDFLKSGGGAVWWPAPHTPGQSLATLAGTSNDPGTLAWQTLPSPMTLRLENDQDPCVRQFADGSHGNPAAGLFRERLTFRNDWPPTPAILRYADGVPALARLNSSGSLVLWNLPLAASASDWAARAEYLPLLGELLLSLRAPAPAAARWLPGQALSLALDREVLAGDLVVETPDGECLPVQRHTTDSTTFFATAPIEFPGLYRWKQGPEVLGMSVVSFPRVESDLRPMKVDEQQAAWTPARSGADLAGLRDGLPLWPYLLCVALLAALLESILAWRAGQT